MSCLHCRTEMSFPIQEMLESDVLIDVPRTHAPRSSCGGQIRLRPCRCQGDLFSFSPFSSPRKEEEETFFKRNETSLTDLQGRNQLDVVSLKNLPQSQLSETVAKRTIHPKSSLA